MTQCCPAVSFHILLWSLFLFCLSYHVKECALHPSTSDRKIFCISGAAKRTDSVGSLSPLNASVKLLSGPRTSLIASRVVTSEFFGIRCHFLRFSAKTAQTACCCIENLSTILKVEFQRVGSSWMSMCSGRFKVFCVSFKFLIILFETWKRQTQFFEVWTSMGGLETGSRLKALPAARWRLLPKHGIQV